jgi:hypothetical protein
LRQFSGSKPWTFLAEILVRVSDEAEARRERHMLNIRSAQGLAWGSKIDKGFNTNDRRPSPQQTVRAAGAAARRRRGARYLK